ncbi:MAG: hypothetical protein V4467_00090 [Patescibacteria group bacterium]
MTFTNSGKTNINPNQYKFLAFPTKEIDVYKTPALNEKMDTLYRAVTIDYAEKDATHLSVIIGEKDGFISTKDLRYIPTTDKDLLISKWNDVLPLMGYTRGVWQSTRSGLETRVSLELVDSNHARSRIYEYTTDGSKIISLGSTQTRSGILYGAIVIQFIFFTFLILLIAFVVFRNFREKTEPTFRA